MGEQRWGRHEGLLTAQSFERDTAAHVRADFSVGLAPGHHAPRFKGVSGMMTQATQSQNARTLWRLILLAAVAALLVCILSLIHI